MIRRRRSRRLAVLAQSLGAVPILAGAASADEPIVVHRRDGGLSERGVLESLGPDGLRWTTADGMDRRDRWSALREVEGLDAAHRPLLADGTLLWRATNRLERGEIALAAPLFGDLADRWSGEGSLRQVEAMVGLIRCRSRLGDPVGAALASLELLELEDGRDVAAGLERLPGGWPVEASLLAVDPLGEDAARLRVGLRRFAESRVAERADWIETVLLGSPAPEGGTSAEQDALASLCMTLRSLDDRSPTTLLAERDERLADAATPAEERWIHARIAATLAGESDPDLRRRGLLEWLCIPARHPESVEAPLAFRAAAAVAAELGEDDLAWRLSRAAARAVEDLRSRPVPRTTP